MYHLTNTSGSWARTFLEDIGTNTGGTALDIAIDPTTDEPGISYFDMDATSLKYTYHTGSAWSATTVENGADYGRFNSIVYDSVGNVHISTSETLPMICTTPPTKPVLGSARPSTPPTASERTRPSPLTATTTSTSPIGTIPGPGPCTPPFKATRSAALSVPMSRERHAACHRPCPSG